MPSHMPGNLPNWAQQETSTVLKDGLSSRAPRYSDLYSQCKILLFFVSTVRDVSK